MTAQSLTRLCCAVLCRCGGSRILCGRPLPRWSARCVSKCLWGIVRQCEPQGAAHFVAFNPLLQRLSEVEAAAAGDSSEQNVRILYIEAAILIKAGWHLMCDEVCVRIVLFLLPCFFCCSAFFFFLSSQQRALHMTPLPLTPRHLSDLGVHGIKGHRHGATHGDARPLQGRGARAHGHAV